VEGVPRRITPHASSCGHVACDVRHLFDGRSASNRPVRRDRGAQPNENIILNHYMASDYCITRDGTPVTDACIVSDVRAFE